MEKASTNKSNYNKKRTTALTSVIAASFLAILKMGFGITTGSLVILASSIDSILDIVASTFNYISIKESAKPPDEEHRYGHGKVESLAALFQSIVIFGSALFIIYKGILSITNGSHIDHLSDGIVVMVFSTIVSIALTYRLRKVGRELNSEVLKTDALHYATDIYQNIGVLITITLIYLTGIQIFDPIVAFIIGAYIIKQVWDIFISAINCLMDHELPHETKAKLKKIILSHPKTTDFHNLRTRKAGSTIFMDFHLELPHDIKLIEANSIAHEVEHMIQEEFPHAEVLIHPDPYDDSKQDEKRRNKIYGR
ncbi:MAG: cation diffusion facilitator family transporter [Candidatus Peregrinibacteria bacterium]|nr:cation diffusion facilitator family transporter [Candidatus Peregrinibacteria bacterium]MDZ4244520.1 cation diffusion facilitator family transporter [Candidatus Gracilibacteria bacterium]